APTAIRGLHPSVGTIPSLPGSKDGPFLYALWSFETFEHPFVCDFRETLSRYGVQALLRRTEQQLSAPRTAFLERYRPSWSEAPDFPYPTRRVDFDFDGSYAAYNWELFFHIPFLVATQLGKNQRFAEAQKWFQFIFDPTASGDGGLSPQRFWKTLPFFEASREDYAAD